MLVTEDFTFLVVITVRMSKAQSVKHSSKPYDPVPLNGLFEDWGFDAHSLLFEFPPNSVIPARKAGDVEIVDVQVTNENRPWNEEVTNSLGQHQFSLKYYVSCPFEFDEDIHVDFELAKDLFYNMEVKCTDSEVSLVECRYLSVGTNDF
jgi:hypothetical protein